MPTEKDKDSLIEHRSLIGDLALSPPSPVFLCTAALQNPRAPRGFCGCTDSQFSPRPIRPFPFPSPKFPCPIRPHSPTVASRPARGASARRLRGISLGSFPLCVPSDLCGVFWKRSNRGGAEWNTAEIGRNAERERAEARTAFPLRRLSEFLDPPLPPPAPRVGCGPAALCSSYFCGLFFRFNSIETACWHGPRRTGVRRSAPLTARHRAFACKSASSSPSSSSSIRSGRFRKSLVMRKCSVSA